MIDIFTVYYIKKVILEEGCIKERVIKSTMNQEEAEKFMEIAQELKPESNIYMFASQET